MNGLAPQTSLLFDAITRMESIKPFVLVGGTALSLQIGRLKRKNLLAMITNGELYVKDKSFLQLSPVYDVTAMDIQDFIKQKLVNPLIP